MIHLVHGTLLLFLILGLIVAWCLQQRLERSSVLPWNEGAYGYIGWPLLIFTMISLLIHMACWMGESLIALFISYAVSIFLIGLLSVIFFTAWYGSKYLVDFLEKKKEQYLAKKKD